MWDVILESVRTLFIGAILVGMVSIGRKRGLAGQSGWRLVIGGWALILLGSALDVTDNFEALNRFVVIGDTPVQAFLEKAIAGVGGFVVLFFGFLLWLPAGARRLDSLKTDFVSTVSHELRTPITAIFGGLRMVESGALGELPPKAAAAVAIATRNADRLRLLVDDILDLDRLASGQVTLDIQPCPLAPLVEETLVTFGPYAEEFGVAVVRPTVGADAMVLADGPRLGQVLHNLLSNAAKFADPNTSITVSATQADGKWRIAVQNRGPVIPPATRDQLFEPFRQAAGGDARARGGTGLGLTIARAFITRMDGTIGVTSSAAAGTTFWIELPAG